MNCSSLIKLIVALVAVAAVDQVAATPPHLASHGTATQLIVNDKPMLMLAGELANSSASDSKYMQPHWARLKQMHLNTVLAPVYWELIEPVEGKYDWSSVDSLIKSAHSNDLKLVFLWFGAWKNSMSTYVPSWIKRDQQKYPRVQLANGSSVEILSAFSQTTLDADSRVFAALLQHIKQIDDKTNTVLMIQVENEIGMLPIARERGANVDQLFNTEIVPSQLIARLSSSNTDLATIWKRQGAKQSGTWSAVFGEGYTAAEAFQAWHYSLFANALAEAGKKEYPLPMYVNVALNRPGKSPGEYPSGGPLPHLLDVWKVGAPALDMLSPDIYFPNFVDLIAIYKRSDNPLFIPEANNADRPEVPANAFYAIGKHDAMGFGPFSIDSIDDKPAASSLIGAYSVLKQLTPTILANQGTGRMSGFKPRVLFDGTVEDAPVTTDIGDYRFTVNFVDPWNGKSSQENASHGGLIIQIEPEEYLIAGQGITVTFTHINEATPQAGIDSAVEGEFDHQGHWIPGRHLNGDQTHQGRHIRLEAGRFQIQRVKLYGYR